MAKVKKSEASGKKLKVKGKVKKVKKEGNGQTEQAAPEKEEKSRFAKSGVFSKPADLSALFQAIKGTEVSAGIVRLRMQTESVEHGRGKAIVRHFTFRKFDEQPKAVFFMATPSSSSGGSFEPTDRLLKPGEQLEVSYTLEVEGGDRPVFFVSKGYFLRNSFYIAEDPNNPGKHWAGPRETAVEKFPKNVIVAGDDVIEVRIENATSFPNGPGMVQKDVLDRYLSGGQLYVVPGGGPWAQRSTQGNFFEDIRDPLNKFLEKDNIKLIDQVNLQSFANMGDVTILTKERLLADIEHDVARPGVIKNPNDNLREINNNIGFLLHFKMDEEIKEIIMSKVPNKAGPEEDVYLPLVLERVSDSKEQYRVTFRLFPRDLVEERGRKAAMGSGGVKFTPPYALYPGAENHNTYSKLLIALSQRFREDEKPEEDKLKSEKLVASVQERMAEQKHKFVDEKVKSAFQNRVAAKKRKEEGA